MRIYEPAEVTKRLVDSEELAALIRAANSAGNAIAFNAPGGSMEPFIHSGDKIVISPVDARSIRLGDILAFVHASDGRVIAHRVVRIADKKFLCKGDNAAAQNDGWIVFEQVLGRVEGVERAGKPVRLGVGIGKGLIAWLSGMNWLGPLVRLFRKIKWDVIRTFSTKNKKLS